MIIQGTYTSEVLQSKRPFVAVLPEKPDDDTKTIFLLHGVGTDYTEWLINVPLEQWAKDNNIAFMCPNGGNTFYTDHANNENYGAAIGDEFYHVMARTFPLNMQYANTSIAGFSMGGYGAIRLGLKYQHYSNIGGFSPAFVFYKRHRNDPLFKEVFYKGLEGSDNDCVKLYQDRLQSGAAMPEITLFCGNEDPLDKYTQEFYHNITAIKQHHLIAYHQQAGFHSFDLWLPALKEFIKNKIVGQKTDTGDVWQTLTN
ncbi:alpha/beta hydrolase [Lacticaseibacillus chiayiensis]|uniref:alpha/beta hydrolase n=1 Tax=Lacticaseibacillus chiayiensis TaxID=2100821 RepID=UPI0010101E79|nr:alpha/beta hydrolase-fold protein [Lacticaseibacillus chiayiensis]QVI34563.1 hypothetical protein KG086_12455 [Lacticaseibacillus chiayiensis]RXT56290.1 hypothetical protein CHT97_11690 [Lacticaseibacillus chiayiensis]